MPTNIDFQAVVDRFTKLARSRPSDQVIQIQAVGFRKGGKWVSAYSEVFIARESDIKQLSSFESSDIRVFRDRVDSLEKLFSKLDAASSTLEYQFESGDLVEIPKLNSWEIHRTRWPSEFSEWPCTYAITQQSVRSSPDWTRKLVSSRENTPYFNGIRELIAHVSNLPVYHKLDARDRRLTIVSIDRRGRILLEEETKKYVVLRCEGDELGQLVAVGQIIYLDGSTVPLRYLDLKDRKKIAIKKKGDAVRVDISLVAPDDELIFSQEYRLQILSGAEVENEFAQRHDAASRWLQLSLIGVTVSAGVSVLVWRWLYIVSSTDFAFLTEAVIFITSVTLTIVVVIFLSNLWPTDSRWLAVATKSGVPSVRNFLQLFASIITPFGLASTTRRFAEILDSNKDVEVDELRARVAELEGGATRRRGSYRAKEELTTNAIAAPKNSEAIATVNETAETTMAGAIGSDAVATKVVSTNETGAPEKPPHQKETAHLKVKPPLPRSKPSQARMPVAVTKFINESRKRLLEALDKLEEKANRNLWFGLLLSVCGLGAIVFAVYSISITKLEKMSNGTYQNYLILLTVPKLVLGILFEITAMFFLRLYRQGLDDYKYYHNEITNIESKWIALCSSLENSHGPIAAATIEQAIVKLAETERNFILKKGESTVGLEVDRIRQETEQRYLEAFNLLKLGGFFSKTNEIVADKTTKPNA